MTNGFKSIGRDKIFEDNDKVNVTNIKTDLGHLVYAEHFGKLFGMTQVFN